MDLPKIISQKTVFNDVLRIEKAEIQSGENKYSRLRVNRQEAATVLLFNTETKKIILTKQFRYAISDRVKEPVFELLAGKVDPDETPLQAAIRETEEEVGYKVKEKNIQLLVSCFASPGYTSEKFYVYYATVDNSDKTSNGGGLEHENEDIQIIEIDPEEFNEILISGKIEDSKTYVAGLFMMQQQKK